MKLALLTDTHFGIYKASDTFLKSQLDFFENQLFPYLRDNEIDTIIHLGDLFDNRVNINVKVMNSVYSLLSEKGSDFKWFIIKGNHDQFFKLREDIHSLKAFKDIPNVNVIDDIELIKFDDRDVLLVPWQVDNKEFEKRVANKNIHCDVCMGHLETKGFELNKGKVCDVGINSNVLFNNYTLTFSGHFHKRSVKKQNDGIVQYIGNTYHLTRNDIGEDRGFVVFDTDTLEYEFINNLVSLKFVSITFPERLNKKKIEGNIIDVVVDVLGKSYDEVKFQQYLQKIEKLHPILPPVVKIQNNFETNLKHDFKVQTVNDLIEEYVSKLKISHKEEIVKKLINLYNECRTGV